ncbi:unknown [Feldmannia species virus]|uniref:Uncharacterized protein n=1 Tax=Feldmannia species virus TaxID=39420 RepID=B5LWJ2_9PHYC|nr:hypothetical protein FeldSpV_gp103 [Feldmannia species virus]ACH46855.1 unknown [Feldmannia species virus]
MSQSQSFFRELENFLPIYVSVLPSYAHAILVFLALSLTGYLVSVRLSTDPEEEKKQNKSRFYVMLGVTALASLFASDVAFNVSWILRNRVNRKHLVYKRWFR